MRLRLPVGRSLRKERAFPGVSGEVEGIPPAGCACHLPLTREAKGNRGFRVWGIGEWRRDRDLQGGRNRGSGGTVGGAGVGVCGAVSTFLAEKHTNRMKNGLEITTMFARGEGSKEGKGASRQRRGGRTGWGKGGGPAGGGEQKFQKNEPKWTVRSEFRKSGLSASFVFSSVLVHV